MNINTIGNSLSFRKSVIAQINQKGIGPIVTEHLPDDMHHGNHKKAIIYNTVKGIRISFENTISKDNWKNLNTKNCLNKLHNNGSTIDTHGEGLQNLFSIAKNIFLYNFDETNNKITVKELGYGKFFKELETYKGANSSNLAQKWSKETTYDLNDDGEHSDDGNEKFKTTEIYKEFQSGKGKFIGWKFKFGYLIHFEMNTKAPDYDEQQRFLNLSHDFVCNNCPEIRIKNSQSQYNIQTISIKENGDVNGPFLLETLKKDDPIKFKHRKLHLECQIQFIKDINENRKTIILDKIVVYFPELNKNLIFTRDLTNGAWENAKLVEDNPEFFEDGSFKWDVKLDLFQINTEHYFESDSKKHGWIILQMENGDKILVNLQPIDVKFLGAAYTEYCREYRKSIRVVTTIKDMKFSHSDGLKPESKWGNILKKAIKCIFKDVYAQTPEFTFFHKKLPIAPIDISLSDTTFDNILRTSQSKKKRKIKKKKKSPPSSKTNFKITQKQTSIKSEVQKEVANKEITKKQKIRHRGKGGWLYLFQHPGWRVPIAKFGLVEQGNSGRNWQNRMEEHQRHHPVRRLHLLMLIRVPYDVKRFENAILAKFQSMGLQYKTTATSTSEYILLKNECGHVFDIKKLILDELPKSSRNEEDEISTWNNVIIREEGEATEEYGNSIE